MKSVSTFLSLFLLWSSVSFAQNVLTKESPQHELLLGTSLKIIPPVDFEKGDGFFGYQHIKTSSSIIAFQVNIPFSKQTAGFTKEILNKDTSYTIKEIRRFKINSDSAAYVSLTQKWEGALYFKEILAIGNFKKTAVLNAGTPISQPGMVTHLKKSLFSTILTDEVLAKPEEIIDFTLSSDSTNLLPFEIKGLNALIYANKKLDGKPVFIATKSLATIHKNHKEFFTNLISDTNTTSSPEVISFDEISAHNMHGFHAMVVGTNKKSNLQQLTFTLILFTATNHYYSFTGKFNSQEVTQEQVGTYIDSFIQIFSTFKRK